VLLWLILDDRTTLPTPVLHLPLVVGWPLLVLAVSSEMQAALVEGHELIRHPTLPPVTYSALLGSKMPLTSEPTLLLAEELIAVL
jgi:hypothetical protein